MDKLIEFIRPMYALNDTAHDLNHALAVRGLALELAERLDILQYDAFRIKLEAACLLHDITVSQGKKDHHITASIYVTTHKDELIELIGIGGTPQQQDDAIYEISIAVLQHRASYPDAINSLLSMLVSCADRGKVTTDYSIYDRAYMYSIAENGGEHSQACMQAYTHVREKYGRSGYSNNNPLHTALFADEIAERALFIDTRAPSDVLDYLSRFKNN